MNLREDEAPETTEEEPVISLYSDIKKIVRGKVDVDYEDGYESVFGILINAIIELKFNSETKSLIIRLYKEPTEDVIQNLSMTNMAQNFELSFPHVLIENSKDIITLFSFYKVVPEEEIKKIMLQDHNVETYKDLLNLGYEIFKNDIGA